MQFGSLACVVVAFGAVLTAGCGGGGGTGAAGTTRSTSRPVAVTRPTGEWVAGYCSAALELFVFLVDSRDSTLGGFLSPTDAGRDLSFRTGIFVHEINRLGRPDTPKGDEGLNTVRALASNERASADRIVGGTAGKPPKGTLARRTKLVHDEVNGSLKAITDTTARLGRDDAAVGKAIKVASDCVDLAADMRKHYPSSPSH